MELVTKYRHVKEVVFFQGWDGLEPLFSEQKPWIDSLFDRKRLLVVPSGGKGKPRLLFDNEEVSLGDCIVRISFLQFVKFSRDAVQEFFTVIPPVRGFSAKRKLKREFKNHTHDSLFSMYVD